VRDENQTHLEFVQYYTHLCLTLLISHAIIGAPRGNKNDSQQRPRSLGMQDACQDLSNPDQNRTIPEPHQAGDRRRHRSARWAADP